MDYKKLTIKTTACILFSLLFASFAAYSAEDAKQLFKNYGFETTEKTVVIPITDNDITLQEFGEMLEGDGKSTIWLHVKVKKECFYLYDKHRHTSWVTIGSKGGPRHNVTKLELLSSIGGGNEVNNSCRNCSEKSKLFEEYNLYCRSSCARGKIGNFIGGRVCI